MHSYVHCWIPKLCLVEFRTISIHSTKEEVFTTDLGLPVITTEVEAAIFKADSEESVFTAYMVMSLFITDISISVLKVDGTAKSSQGINVFIADMGAPVVSDSGVQHARQIWRCQYSQ